MKLTNQLVGMLALLCIHHVGFAAATDTPPPAATTSSKAPAKCPCDFSKAALNAVMANLKDGMITCSISQTIRLEGSAKADTHKKPATSQALSFISLSAAPTNPNAPVGPQATWGITSDFNSNYGETGAYWACSTQLTDPGKARGMKQLSEYVSCQNDLDNATQSLGVFCKA